MDYKYMLRPAFCAAAFLAANAAAQQACPDWTDPHTKIVEVGPSADLPEVVRNAASGTTILLQSGTYKLGAALRFGTDDVTLRSKTGKREDVILDGNTASGALNPATFTPELVVVSASRVTVADLTVKHARHHNIHAFGAQNRTITRFTMRNLHVLDCGQQLIKVNSSGTSPNYYVDSSSLVCSHIGFEDNSVMEPMTEGFYTGGIDIHFGQGWTIRGNLFKNIQREGKLMEHGIHMWSKCRGALIENNRFEDVHRAIGLGMKTSESNKAMERHYPDGKGDAPYLDFIDGTIRNNVIFNRAGIKMESGMELANVLDVEVYHNTVVSVDKPFNSIEYRYPDTKVVIKNNLVSHNILRRESAAGAAEGNLEGATAPLFLDMAKGDLKLKLGAAAVIDQGVKLPAGECDADIDGEARDAKPDIGADEFRGPAAVRPKSRLGSAHRGAGVAKSSSIIYERAGDIGEKGFLSDGKQVPAPAFRR